MAVIFVNIINQPIFVIETRCFLCEAGTGFVIIRVYEFQAAKFEPGGRAAYEMYAVPEREQTFA
jgi:hypothetical protein